MSYCNVKEYTFFLFLFIKKFGFTAVIPTNPDAKVAKKITCRGLPDLKVKPESGLSEFANQLPQRAVHAPAQQGFLT
jgi:hypothetical protein